MPHFTLGKWWYVILSHETPVVLDIESRVIADRLGKATRAESAANARLIACAPDMYFVIRDLLEDETFKNEALRKKMSAIIARADGKLPYKMWGELFESSTGKARPYCEGVNHE